MSRRRSNDAVEPAESVDESHYLITCKAAAKRLGVGVELIHGLAVGGQIRSVKSVGRSGAPVFMVSQADISKLAQEIRG